MNDETPTVGIIALTILLLILSIFGVTAFKRYVWLECVELMSSQGATAAAAVCGGAK